MELPQIADDMAVYYARRAATYERIYAKPERQADLRAIEAALPPLFTGRRVLEVACGTGWWTPFGARCSQSWLATDLNPETMDMARRKPLPRAVRFAAVDAFDFAGLGGQTFDAAFAGCWWSHVPLQRLPQWLSTLHARLEPGALAVFLDNLHVPGSSTPVSRRDEAGNTWQRRTLDDGSAHEILKNFPGRDQAISMLGSGVRDPQWVEYGHYWLLSYRLN